jgi:hypothetical protein
MPCRSGAVVIWCVKGDSLFVCIDFFVFFGALFPS